MRSWLIVMVALVCCSCASKMTVVRLPNGTAHGSVGAPLPVKTIESCSALSEERRGSCVYTVTDCPQGIGVVEIVRRGSKSDITVQCFVPSAVSDGNDEEETADPASETPNPADDEDPLSM